jgi:hypothetical protein
MPGIPTEVDTGGAKTNSCLPQGYAGQIRASRHSTIKTNAVSSQLNQEYVFKTK